MTYAGGALANAVGALGNAGCALTGRGEVDDAAVMIWKGRALLLAGVVL